MVEPYSARFQYSIEILVAAVVFAVIGLLAPQFQYSIEILFGGNYHLQESWRKENVSIFY